MRKPSRRFVLPILALTFSAPFAWWLTQPLRARSSGTAEVTWDPPFLPDTDAGQQVAAYLKAFNSGNAEALTQFVQGHFSETGPGGSSLQERARSQQQLYNTSRGLDLYSVSQRGPNELEIVARLRLTQAWRQMTFYFDSTPRHLITGVRMLPVDAPEIPLHRQTLPFQQSLKSYLDRLVREDQFSGVVMVSRDGKVLFSRANGRADKEKDAPITLETSFHYASVGKMFTAVAIGQLAESGKLSFDATVQELLPTFPAEWSDQITIDHLLTHQSGIPDYFEVPGAEDLVRSSSNPQHDYQQIFAALPLRFSPGAKHEYSNSNYILLGAIVEQLSGQAYEDYLREHVFAKAGMNQTTLDLEAGTEIAPAIGYTELGSDGDVTPGQRRPNTDFLTRRGSAAGGGITTAADMLKFSEGIRNDRLLTQAMTEQLLTERLDGPRPGESYARGFMVRQSRSGRVFGHSGGFPGVDAQIDIYDSGWTVVVLSNYEAVGETVSRHIESLLADQPVETNR